MKLSIVVPMLNEHKAIAETLRSLRIGAPAAEIIVVDGGSEDGSRELAAPACDQLLIAPRGRGRQMNRGATVAKGEVLAFVHADTRVPATFARDIEAALRDPATVGGRFDLELDEPAPLYRALGRLISLRSRLSRVCTGDQAIFVRAKVFKELGGFREIELCEDLDFARRLKRAGRVACLRSRVITSARRWRSQGVLQTILRMWLIKIMFLVGFSARWLSRRYSDVR
jgi:rSAM/selenodomain-associated transferase 2